VFSFSLFFHYLVDLHVSSYSVPLFGLFLTENSAFLVQFVLIFAKFIDLPNQIIVISCYF